MSPRLDTSLAAVVDMQAGLLITGRAQTRPDTFGNHMCMARAPQAGQVDACSSNVPTNSCNNVMLVHSLTGNEGYSGGAECRQPFELNVAKHVVIQDCITAYNCRGNS